MAFVVPTYTHAACNARAPLCRGTTTYLVQRRIDMLPKPLTEDICSLRSGEERLAFSILWEVTPTGSIVGRHFTKSVILYGPSQLLV